MRTIDIRKAKAQLSTLVDDAAKGESFVIAKAGRPLVKVVPFELPQATAGRRIGFLKGEISVPRDFDRLGSRAIGRAFEGDEV